MRWIKKAKTLKIKFTVITFFTYLTLVLTTLFACYLQVQKNVWYTYEMLANEVLNLAKDDIRVDAIPSYLSGDYDKAEYQKTADALKRYADACHEIYYLYAYKINDDGKTATVLFDVSMPYDEGDKLGDIYKLEPDLVKQSAKLQRGEPIPTLSDHTKYGHLLTCAKPLIDSKGVCQGYLFVDFNIHALYESNVSFILLLFISVFVLMLVILYFGTRAVSRRITTPIEKMYLCLNEMSYSTEADRKNNIKKMEELDIHTNQEIMSLHKALIDSMKDSLRYVKEYHVATEKLGVASEMAYTDVLTGLGNKNAYERKKEKLWKEVQEGDREFSVMMFDINNLKYVNDTFGHERGDEYIKGCCRIMESMFSSSPIYRIGGDEFVAILEDQDYYNKQQIYANAITAFALSYEDDTKEPWERYSASIGMSNYFSYDTSLDGVFKRADAAMYLAKSQFKTKYGSYR